MHHKSVQKRPRHASIGNLSRRTLGGQGALGDSAAMIYVTAVMAIVR
jgi:hypothetical protein